MKRCTRCGVEKDESMFSKAKGYKGNLKSWCKDCINDFGRKYWHSLSRRHRVECRILKKHHEEMKDDPEHLTTGFLQKVIGVECDNHVR